MPKTWLTWTLLVTYLSCPTQLSWIASLQRDLNVSRAPDWRANHSMNKVWESLLSNQIQLKHHMFFATVESVLFYILEICCWSPSVVGNPHWACCQLEWTGYDRRTKFDHQKHKGWRNNLDKISNDALKLGLPVLEKASLHAFNNVMQVQTFRETWDEGLIVPILKKGDKLNVDNYCGIITSSCIGKIIRKVIAARIDSYMNTLNFRCINQCGFKKDHRNEGNLFILNTIHDNCVARCKGNIYLAFIDFLTQLIVKCCITNHWNMVSPDLCLML